MSSAASRVVIDLELQHDDHIWLTILGEAWAIQAIHRYPGEAYLFRLWRGYEPNLEFTDMVLTNTNWERYCVACVAVMHKEYPEIELI